MFSRKGETPFQEKVEIKLKKSLFAILTCMIGVLLIVPTLVGKDKLGDYSEQERIIAEFKKSQMTFSHKKPEDYPYFFKKELDELTGAKFELEMDKELDRITLELLKYWEPKEIEKFIASEELNIFARKFEALKQDVSVEKISSKFVEKDTNGTYVFVYSADLNSSLNKVESSLRQTGIIKLHNKSGKWKITSDTPSRLLSKL